MLIFNKNTRISIEYLKIRIFCFRQNIRNKAGLYLKEIFLKMISLLFWCLIHTREKNSRIWKENSTIFSGDKKIHLYSTCEQGEYVEKRENKTKFIVLCHILLDILEKVKRVELLFSSFNPLHFLLHILLKKSLLGIRL